jgi:hypothetical protein
MQKKYVYLIQIFIVFEIVAQLITILKKKTQEYVKVMLKNVYIKLAMNVAGNVLM